MPLPKPKKGESQDDFIERCMHEAYGDNAPDDRTQEQAVAMCHDAWRERDKAMKTKASGGLRDADLPEPEQDEAHGDFIDRCIADVKQEFEDMDEDEIEEACEEAWDSAGGEGEASHKPARVRAKQRETKQGHFSADDCPDPEDDETQDDYITRCTDELVGETGSEDEEFMDDATAACEDRWAEEQDKIHKPARVKRQPPPKGITHFKTHAEEVQGMEFILSDETPDRMGDIIAADGWDLDNFNKNPIALFNHNSNFPIGRWHNLRAEQGALRGHLEMAPKGTSDRIDEIRALIDAGILRAVSVGFRPLEELPRKGAKGEWLGSHFTRCELVETSLVSVPANPNALAVAKSLNISPATIDFVFNAGSGKTENESRRSRFTGGSAIRNRSKRSGAMTLAQRIKDIQAAITDRKEKLTAHWAKVDDSNVSDADLQTTNELNAEIDRLEKQHQALLASEKILGEQTEKGKGNGRALPRQRAITVIHDQRREDRLETPNTSTLEKSAAGGLDFLDLLVRGGTVAYVAKMWNKSIDETRHKIYGDDEDTKFMCELVTRAASAPAMTTVVGWAAELVQQVYTELMPTLMPKGILTRLAAKGLTLSFGRAGKINIPTRSRTPSIAGSFVGEGQAIPVRQGAFTSQALTPKKMAVITTWTREMDEHSIPAIEGILREAIQVDTTVAVDSVLIDANAATVIRPAGLLNGVAALTATAGGGLAAVIGDLKQLIGALTTNTYGNIRTPVWLMNPSELLTLSLTSAATTGIFPFAAQVAAGNLLNIPIIDSGTVPAKTVILVDAADFVVAGGEAPRFEISDQATLHMEDTNPADLVGPGSPGTVAAPQRSLFQTDSMALRMVMPLNWVQRRAGTVAWTQSVTW